MIGAWSSQGGGAKMYSIVMQDYLVARIPVLLQKRHSGEQFQGTLPAAICQTAFFTTGIERLVSSSMLILASLVTILHETEFFNPATVYKDEKLGYFLPMHHAALGERQRLAQYLFKIDKYFSILRGHRGIIPLDALHFPPPSSYALWNGDGLDV
ncbi:hypothetical protein M7I_8179 [Glarea lozoyensis 74030]|uniref:Uncharacterized protein n=1 Tax=Glarea lozoyensis (strain ATCC 74030 / MF5533) TaxID=1104152 RepID=H0EZB6_GLAL7|nr:hypothetical protein M7I_8179 [Glarea lozoyensis 74030]